MEFKPHQIKILLLGDYPENYKIETGVQGVLVSLTDELIKRKEIDLVLVSLSESKYVKKYQEGAAIYQVHFRPFIFRAMREFDSIISRENPDIIHLQGVVPGCFLFKKKFKDIFIVTQHAILKEEMQWQVSFLRKIKFFIKGLVERFYLGRIQNIIFISDYNRGLYLDTYGSPKEVHTVTIPNPVNSVFNIVGGASSSSPKPNELYFVGEIKKRKGLHVLLKALSQIKAQQIPTKLHVIGGFKEMAYKKKIMELIVALDLQEEVKFCGWKSPEELVEYASGIPIFVLPSFQETLPLSIAEAMSQQKLVVASEVGGTSEMIEDGHSGYLFPAGDHDVLAKILLKIFSSPDRLPEMVTRARNESNRYKAEAVGEETISFYMKTIERGSKSG